MLDMMFKLKTNRDDYAVVRFCSEDNAGKYLIFEHGRTVPVAEGPHPDG